ncbi:MAG: hypothetical protein ABIV63_12755 [Caldimonas sp.]
MKKSIRIGKLAALAAGVAMSCAGALAQPKAVADVRAEAASAAKAGLIDRGEVTRVPAVESTLPRGDVKAETRAAVKARAIDHGEVTTTPPSPPSSKTRAEVKADAASALHSKPVAKPRDEVVKP